MVLTCFSLTGIAWLAYSLRYLDYIVNNGLTVGMFLYLSSLTLPFLLWIILPLSVFIATTWTFNKLVSESELVIFRNAGLSPANIIRPVAVFAFGVMLCSYIIAAYLLPASYREFKDIQTFTRNNYASFLLQEGVFFTPVKNFTAYFRKRDENGLLHGLLAHDRSNEAEPVTYIAQKARLQNSETGPQIMLWNGTRQYIDPKTGKLTIIEFESYVHEFSIVDTDASHRRWREPQERYIHELFDVTDTPPHLQQKLRAEGHHRIIWPFYNMILAMVALLAFLIGEFTRYGQGRRIVSSIIVTIGTIITALMLHNISASNANMIYTSYGVAFSLLLASIYMLLVQPKWGIDALDLPVKIWLAIVGLVRKI